MCVCVRLFVGECPPQCQWTELACSRRISLPTASGTTAAAALPAQTTAADEAENDETASFIHFIYLRQ